VAEQPALRHLHLIGQTADAQPLEPDPAAQVERVPENGVPRVVTPAHGRNNSTNVRFVKVQEGLNSGHF
jgi:hypothetical protein